MISAEHGGCTVDPEPPHRVMDTPVISENMLDMQPTEIITAPNGRQGVKV